jgi:hypothetical protein
VPAALALAGLVLAPASARGQIVRGMVFAAGTGEPIPGAELVLRDEAGGLVASAVSATDGRFALRPDRGGTVRMEVSHLGYAGWETADFELGDVAIIEVEVRLGVEAIPIEPLTVIARSRMSLGGVAGFEQRARDPSIDGYFLDEEAIARRPMSTPSNLVLQAPGMSVGLASSAASFDRGVIMSGGCAAQTYIDGIRVQQGNGASVDDLLTIDRIAGVEIYPRRSGTPIQYSDATGQGCGVVLFWTKPPEANTGLEWGTGRILAGTGLFLGLLTLALVG